MSAQPGQASKAALPTPQFLVGVDIASQKFMVAVLKADKTVMLKPLEFDNSTAGFAKFCTQLDQLGLVPAHTLVGMEATARYWENLYHYLNQHGYQLILLHPAQTHQWAANRGLRAKTDQLDSLTIARHLLAEDARPAYVAQELIASYRELLRLHNRLTEEASRYKVEIQDLLVVLFPEIKQVFADPCGKTCLKLLSLYPSAEAMVQAGVASLKASLKEFAPRNYGTETAQTLVGLASHSCARRVAQAARSTSLRIMCEQLLHTQENLDKVGQELASLLALDKGATALTSVSDFGPKTVIALRAELGEVSRFAGRDQVVAYAGLDLTVKQSGKWKGQVKLSKRGSGQLRRILYMAVFNCLSHRRKESAFRDYYEALVARGMAKRSAMVAVMRKMLIVAYSLLKNGGSYDPKKVWVGASTVSG
jgi:transposase